MKKNILILTLILILISTILISCKKVDNIEQSTTSIESSTTTVTTSKTTTTIPTSTSTITTSSTTAVDVSTTINTTAATTSKVSTPIDLNNVSLLSGIPFSDFSEDMNKDYTPVAIMIENSKYARPQYGLQCANIVYEAPVEGLYTRFMCIYNDTLPYIVEPVRSTRIYFLQMQQQYDCIFAFFGGPDNKNYPSYIYGDASDHLKIYLDGVKGPHGGYFYRDDNREAPHNVEANIKSIAKLYDYDPTPISFLFNYDKEKIYGDNSINAIVIPFFGVENIVTYKYDINANKLLRYTDGEPFNDESTNEKVSVQNLIIQYVQFLDVNELYDRKTMNVLGTGKSCYVIDGIYFQGTWERETYEDITKYYDESGNEIQLTPGNTWITLHPNSHKVSVS